MCKLSKRKKLIIIIILLSIILILFISTFFILNNFFIQKKTKNISSVLKNNNLSSTKTIDLKKAPLIISNQYKNNSWRIIIKKINLDAPILQGVSREVLRKGVGHFENTGITSGNICLAAHNRGYKYNYFQEIKRLDLNDEIIYTAQDEEKVFLVKENKIINETDLSVLEDTQETKLTLITCEENKREFRRCIIAVEKNNYLTL